MITNVQSVTIYVNDQDKAIDFYVNKLGFEKRSDQKFGEKDKMRWVEVVPPGGQTAIILAKDFGEWSKDSVGHFSRVVFAVADMQGTYETLSQRGVEFVEKPTPQPWGMVQVCRRATSVIVAVETTDTEDGTMSPCRLKLTTKTNWPSGVMSAVAGKYPSVAFPRTESSFVEYFHSEPKGRPCAIET